VYLTGGEHRLIVLLTICWSLLGTLPLELAMAEDDLPLELELQKLCNRLTAAQDCASLQCALNEITVYLTAKKEHDRVHATFTSDQDSVTSSV
jgi:hypothetical protein